MLGGVAIPEYSELAPLPPFPPSTDDEVRAAIVSLGELEILRRVCAAAQPCKVALFDRSPLSCIAFQYAVRCLGVPCDHHLTVDLFVAAAREGRIAVPHLYIHLDVDRRTALTRQYERGPRPPASMSS